MKQHITLYGEAGVMTRTGCFLLSGLEGGKRLDTLSGSMSVIRRERVSVRDLQLRHESIFRIQALTMPPIYVGTSPWVRGLRVGEGSCRFLLPSRASSPSSITAAFEDFYDVTVLYGDRELSQAEEKERNCKGINLLSCWGLQHHHTLATAPPDRCGFWWEMLEEQCRRMNPKLRPGSISMPATRDKGTLKLALALQCMAMAAGFITSFSYRQGYYTVEKLALWDDDQARHELHPIYQRLHRVGSSWALPLIKKEIYMPNRAMWVTEIEHESDMGLFGFPTTAGVIGS